MGAFSIRKIFYDLKLHKTIIISLLLGLSIPILLGTYYIKHNQQIRLQQELQAFHHYITNTIAKSMSTIVWDFRQDSAKNILEPIFDDPRIVKIVVWDTDALFAQMEKPVGGEETIATREIPISLAGKVIGRVEVWITDKQYQESLNQLNMLLLGIILSQIVLALLLVIPILYLKVIQPVSRLIRQSELIADNRLDQPFMWKQSDELGTLGQSFEMARVALVLSFTELNKSKETIRSLLDNSGEGFLSFDKSFLVDPVYSRECEHIFNQAIAGEEICGLLLPEDEYARKQLERNFAAIFDFIHDALKTEVFLELLPEEFKLNQRCYKAVYKLLPEGQIIMRLSDITAEKALEVKLQEEQDRLRFLVSVVQMQKDYFESVSGFETFLEEEFDNIAKSDLSQEEKVARIYRKIHTFKGTFAQLDSPGLPGILHQIEDTISSYMDGGMREDTLERIRELLRTSPCKVKLEEEIGIIRIMLGEEFIRSKGNISIPEDELKYLEQKIMNLYKQDPADARINDELTELLQRLRRLRYVPLSTLLETYPKMVEQTASRLGKEIREFFIEGGGDIYVNPDVYRPFTNTLIHLFRNAIDHGIETPDERLEAGKSEVGRITCVIEQDQEQCHITIRDDGRGIDPEALKAKAEQLGIQWFGNLYEVIFEDSFSTKETVSELSGRGVGLAALKAELLKLGGSIEVDSEVGKGSTFTVHLPVNTV